jgi:hypothetical protein
MRVEVFGNDFRVSTVTRRYAKWPRLGVVVVPAGRRPRFGLGPWLRARHGIEQLHTISVTGVEWDGLTSHGDRSRAAERLRERLALSLLGRPELVVVAGFPPVDTDWHAWPRSRRDVERIVERIRSWDLPAKVVGVWVDERWGVDECVVESEEVGRHEPTPVNVLGAGVCPQWLAESVWETEGGRLKETREPAVAAGKHRTQRRTRHADSDHGPWTAGHSKAGQGTPSRDAVVGLPRLRSGPAGLAHA